MVVGDLNNSHHYNGGQIDPAIRGDWNRFLGDLDHQSVVRGDLDAVLPGSVARQPVRAAETQGS